MRIIGLTGSIGMGKTTTAAMFREQGAAVHHADAAVHRLYAGEAAAAVGALFPGVAADGRVDRKRLGERVLADPAALAALEAIIHPLVRRNEAAFLARAAGRGRRIAVLDVPLLLETDGAARVDAIVVATAAATVQRARVLARPGMDAAKFDALLARQMPDAEKRRRAHFTVDTGQGLAAASRQVEAILRALAAAT